MTDEGILLHRRAKEILSLVDKTQRKWIEQSEHIEAKITSGCGVDNLAMADFSIKKDELDAIAKNTRETMGGLLDLTLH